MVNLKCLVVSIVKDSVDLEECYIAKVASSWLSWLQSKIEKWSRWASWRDRIWFLRSARLRRSSFILILNCKQTFLVAIITSFLLIVRLIVHVIPKSCNQREATQTRLVRVKMNKKRNDSVRHHGSRVKCSVITNYVTDRVVTAQLLTPVHSPSKSLWRHSDEFPEPVHYISGCKVCIRSLQTHQREILLTTIVKWVSRLVPSILPRHHFAWTRCKSATRCNYSKGALAPWSWWWWWFASSWIQQTDSGRGRKTRTANRDASETRLTLITKSAMRPYKVNSAPQSPSTSPTTRHAVVASMMPNSRHVSGDPIASIIREIVRVTALKR